jgi:pimeloyl-ACP methyl ester carboxylesterase
MDEMIVTPQDGGTADSFTTGTIQDGAQPALDGGSSVQPPALDTGVLADTTSTSNPPSCSPTPLSLDRFPKSSRTTAEGRTFTGWGGAAAPGKAQKVPVIFVHGNGGTAKEWIPFRDSLCKQGYGDLEQWAITFQDYDCSGTCYSGSNTEHATELEKLVQLVLSETQAKRVNIISVSMGVPAVRFYMKFLGGIQRNEVAMSYMVSGPNHGVPHCDVWGASMINVACAELCSSCSWLDKLNQPDETPSGQGDGQPPGQTVIYRTVSFTGDPFFTGDYVSSPKLDGADNWVISGNQHASIDMQDLFTYLAKTQPVP